LPFKENFSSGSIETNFWTKEKSAGTANSPEWACDNIGIDSDGSGAVFYANNSSGRYDASLVSKYLDGRENEKIYLSFLTKPNYDLSDNTITPDSLLIDVYDGTEWNTVWKSIYNLDTGWNTEVVDLSPVAAEKLFSVRFRIKGVNNTSNTKYLFFDDITVSTALPDENTAPHNMLAKKENGKVHLVWQDASSESYALTYANSSARSSIGNEGADFIAVNRFDETDLSVYGDLRLHSISAYIVRNVSEQTKETKLKLAVFDGNKRIVEQDVAEFNDNAWNTFQIYESVSLKGKKLMFGIEFVQHDALEMPMGVDGNRNPATGKGDLYSEDGGITWKTLTEAKKVNNWCIIGNVSADKNQSDGRSPAIVGYNVYEKGVKVNDDLIFGQSLVTDNSDSGETCYTLRAYSTASGISAESEEKCVSNNVSISYPAVDRPKVYPILVSDVLHIESTLAVKNISLYDSSGCLVKYIDHPAAYLSMKDLAKGLYVVKIQTTEGESIYKIIRS
jgi:hypothetical protein